MNLPLVSVITVVYNASATLSKTIRSVASQTYSNIEYIVVDGGSTDGTVDIIRNSVPAVTRWISEKDQGIYDAMNKGADLATGEWIYFLGGDDVLHDNEVISSIFSNPANAGADLLYGDVVSASFKGRYDGRFDYEKLLKRNISHQAIFYKASLFKEEGKFNIAFRGHADWDFNLRCFEAGAKQQYVDIVVSEFGEGGISAAHDKAFLRESLMSRKMKFVNEHPGYLRSVRNYDDCWRLVRNAAIQTEDEFIASANGIEIPPAFLSIFRYQRKIPGRLLFNGFFSKTFMFFCFVLNYRRV